MKVMVVDDEEQYRDYLSAALEDAGHEVKTASSGRESIDVGICFHPDLLISDWMLKNHINGLQVSNLLRTFNPGLRTLLMTGFPSRDLRTDAERMGVSQFIEKPFGLSEVLSYVDEKSKISQEFLPLSSAGIINVASDGRILGMNGTGVKLLEETTAGSSARSMSDVFDEATISRVDESGPRWIKVAPIAAEQIDWWVRKRDCEHCSVLVVLTTDNAFVRSDPAIQLLLNNRESIRPESWPFDEDVLLLESVRRFRETFAAHLEQVGCVVYKSETQELALKLLEANSQIGIVIVDDGFLDVHFQSFISDLRAIRPDVKIVGATAGVSQSAFEDASIQVVLPQPWVPEDLVRALSQ